MSEKDQQNQIQIELTDEVAQGEYANLAIITHSTSEFVLDFIRIVPGVPKAKVKSRVILSPEHAKRLLLALNDNVTQYEKLHGTVKLDNSQIGDFSPVGQA